MVGIGLVFTYQRAATLVALTQPKKLHELMTKNQFATSVNLLGSTFQRSIIIIEFCPKCFHPLDDSDDDGRLCPACRWFGDKAEICITPPPPTSLELAFTQMLALYRDICRMELLAEQVAEGKPEHRKHLNAVKARVSHARHSLLHMFRSVLP